MDLVRDLPRADGAFVGSVLERTESGDTITYLFRVEQVYKGEIENRVEVVTNAQGATCGLDYAIGARAALLLERVDDVWRSGLCGEVEPAAFLELTDVKDNALPAINLGGYVVGFLILGAAVFLLVRRRRRYSGLR